MNTWGDRYAAEVLHPDSADPYAVWVAAFVSDALRRGGLRSRCREAVALMQIDFPELVGVPGQVELEDGTRVCHWWMVTPVGRLLDPTALQFDAAPVRYHPLADEDPQPTGQCLECCNYRYGRGGYCSTKCYRRTYRRHRKDPRHGLALMARLMGAVEYEIRTEGR